MEVPSSMWDMVMKMEIASIIEKNEELPNCFGIKWKVCLFRHDICIPVYRTVPGENGNQSLFSEYYGSFISLNTEETTTILNWTSHPASVPEDSDNYRLLYIQRHQLTKSVFVFSSFATRCFDNTRQRIRYHKKPVAYYNNSVATRRLLLSGDIEKNRPVWRKP